MEVYAVQLKVQDEKTLPAREILRESLDEMEQIKDIERDNILKHNERVLAAAQELTACRCEDARHAPKAATSSTCARRTSTGAPSSRACCARTPSSEAVMLCIVIDSRSRRPWSRGINGGIAAVCCGNCTSDSWSHWKQRTSNLVDAGMSIVHCCRGGRCCENTGSDCCGWQWRAVESESASASARSWAACEAGSSPSEDLLKL